jgi:hypothetical protein
MKIEVDAWVKIIGGSKAVGETGKVIAVTKVMASIILSQTQEVVRKKKSFLRVISNPNATTSAASAVAMALAAEEHDPSSVHGDHPLPESIQENQDPDKNVNKNSKAIVPNTCKQIVITVGTTFLNDDNMNQVLQEAEQALKALCGPGSVEHSSVLRGMGQFLFAMTTAGHAQTAQETLDYRWAGGPKCPVGFYYPPKALLSMVADPLPTTGRGTKRDYATYVNNYSTAGPTPPKRSLFDRMSENASASKRLRRR